MLSQEQKQYFKDIYNRDTEYIPNGTNLMDIIPADIIKEKYGLTKRKLYIISFKSCSRKGIRISP